MNPQARERGIPAGIGVALPLLLAGSAMTAWLYASRREGSRREPRAEARRRTTRRVRDVMSTATACCRPETPIREIAESMVAHDCGEIPVCDEAGKPVGVVTDRDIVCRLLAKGHDPYAATAKDCMSRPVVTCPADTSLDECVQLMERHQVRRAPVIDRTGAVCGIVSQADVTRKAPPEVAAELVERVSEPNVFASAVGGR